MGLKDRDPFEIFQSWLEEAIRKEVSNPNAMSLATAGKDGKPSARMVLLKDSGPGLLTGSGSPDPLIVDDQ